MTNANQPEILADESPAYDDLAVIILAGGRSERMGGIDKSTIRLNGTRLIDHQLAGVLSLGVEKRAIVIVSTKQLAAEISHTAENPAFGGPLAGISAGLSAIPTGAQRVAILSVDAPDSWQLLPALMAELTRHTERDAAIIEDEAGIANPLCSVWKSERLQANLAEIGAAHNKPARALVHHADWIGVDGGGLEVDYDSLAELKVRGAVELPTDNPH
ncbi:NTP transferase domain-containing protein [Corynebacterium pseudodiphtheriticum]|uniref:molybdenum cofactor guanylyltransferase n=1 Tax=Corynebacterium pseudodiphtheriticum TaxID=37637 RepID=UPI00254A8AA9|nr:NTP transferase domain-containing protein [Corynebacterium pseudodiphtheriticum]MDK8500214.1 NTP transferase domain-containing protein [Corynebacterium pseudodiphtheriticum]MDK8545748.1 NTP transferase domain-containing protein [Corynebacterium pseudodiphtheriticum]MDK8577757.1 NTP transferase domain-containing protein [Corynebacterium pseudodiphtheriticum]MDK8584186.1 NTP transferase domain-containing protein [Corynebacterium pseudodiphtheriticum]MDK8685798.1 NTP transferase domain-contain